MLIVRDRNTGAGAPADSRIPQGSANGTATALNERLYALTDASGSTIAITAIDGTVLERYVYDSNGRPQPLNPDWSAYPGTTSQTGPDQYASLYDWQYLYHGARWLALFTAWTPTPTTTTGSGGVGTSNLGGGLYEYGGGATWVNPYDGRPVQPNTAAAISGGNAYDPTPFGLKATIYGLQAGLVGTGILAGIATGGAATWLIGAAGWTALGTVGAAGVELTGLGTVAVGAAGGAGGGALGSSLDAYSQGQSGSGIAKAAVIGGVAGALCGVAGAAAGVGALGVTCDNLGGTAAGFVRGAVEGATGGFVGGGIQGGITTRSLEGAWNGAVNGAWSGAALGGGLGALLHQVCFVAGTQVVVDIEDMDADGLVASGSDVTCGTVATAQAVRNLRYFTQSIERLVKDGYVVARDQHDPESPLVQSRILHTYVRTAYHLQIVMIQDAAGRQQVLRTTDEHRFYVKWRGWVNAEELVAGDVLHEPGTEDSVVVSSVREEHPEGVMVYNLEVEAAHTYFVRAEESEAEPVWVHNAEGYDGPHQMSGRIVRDGQELMSSPYSSGGMEPGTNSWPEQLSVHTERQFLADARAVVEPGDVVEMAGDLDPCRSGCRPAIRSFVNDTGASATYDANLTGRQFRWSPWSSDSLNGTVLQQVYEDGNLVAQWRYWQRPSGRWTRAGI